MHRPDFFGGRIMNVVSRKCHPGLFEEVSRTTDLVRRLYGNEKAVRAKSLVACLLRIKFPRNCFISQVILPERRAEWLQRRSQ
jgi:hypothetical protein